MGSDDPGGCGGLFACTRCGACCKGYGGTYLSMADIEAIARYLKVTTGHLRTRFTQTSGGRPLIAQSADGYCVFWNKLCTIHPVKPQMCRQWPFIGSILVDVGNWRAMAGSCPGMKADAPEGRIRECVQRALKDPLES